MNRPTRPPGASPAHRDPVTVTVARRVAPGRARDFEDWVDGIVSAAQKYDGFLGSYNSID